MVRNIVGSLLEVGAHNSRKLDRRAVEDRTLAAATAKAGRAIFGCGWVYPDRFDLQNRQWAAISGGPNPNRTRRNVSGRKAKTNMDLIYFIVIFILHIDIASGGHRCAEYGASGCTLFCFDCFVETGTVVTPFLPGDSLLFNRRGFVSYVKPTISMCMSR